MKPAGLPPRKQSGKRIVINDKPKSAAGQAFVTDPRVQKLLEMEPGVESEASLDSEDLRVSGDEQLLNELNGSLSSSEFDQ